ncbi:MAG TPA: biotin/lipoyl-binding protein [Saprospiraceae bacterium]|nr:biotin/lipoyl-binding protein [Saprospiraceae bacterium]
MQPFSDFLLQCNSHQMELNADHLAQYNIEPIGENQYHIIYKNHSFKVRIEHFDIQQGTVTVILKKKAYHVAITDPIGRLIQSMGLQNTAAKKSNFIVSPMPGLVLKILVSEGQQVEKGEPILLLEAMKMENIIKAPYTAVIKSIKVTEKEKVEKSKILIQLED